jgi:hypothetical protein
MQNYSEENENILCIHLSILARQWEDRLVLDYSCSLKYFLTLPYEIYSVGVPYLRTSNILEGSGL